ncbi:MAG: Hsp70 family protein, partial [Myxococcota bacterium]
MPPIIGVDLGTTNTAVAVLENGRPRVIEDDRGYKVLPSVVSAKGEGRFVVGQAAHNLILTRPDRTVYAAKRLIGRRFDSPEVQRVVERVGYQVREAPDGGVQIQVGDTWMTPQEVAAVILQVARGIAEKSLGQPVEEAVITVPAHFNHAQRKATLEAAQIAGMRCERLLNEPTAAALAYGHRKNVERTLVIFDLGGGTFDVSVLRLSGGIYEILATNGDTFLGGEDFDYRIVDHLTDEFKARTGVDLRKDRSALQRIKDAAERAKCELSFSDRTSLVVPHAAPGQNLESTLTRTGLEELTRDLVPRCIEVSREAMAQEGLTVSDIDEVILVGGQTRAPAVREAVAGLFGREPSRTVHPEEVVALGAAVHAATLGDVEGAPAILLDVTPFDLGIDAAGGLFSRVVPRNARIPCSETRTFATVHDDQTTVRVTVRQGESRLSEENEFLGEFLFEGLTPAPRMQTKVAVTFRIDANGMLSVSATEPATGEKRNISIRNYADRNRAVVAAPAGPTGAEGGA